MAMEKKRRGKRRHSRYSMHYAAGGAKGGAVQRGSNIGEAKLREFQVFPQLHARELFDMGCWSSMKRAAGRARWTSFGHGSSKARVVWTAFRPF